MTVKNPDGDVALFIDWENIKWSLQDADMTPNVSAIRETAERYGRVVVAKAYANWQERWHQRDPLRLYEAGIEPVYVPTKSSLRYQAKATGQEYFKGSVDVKMTADCIECAHNYPSMSTFVLVSGDADFIHLVNTLRPYGKRLVAIGVSWSAATRLIQAVDEFLEYDKDIILSPEVARAPAELPAVSEDQLDQALRLVVDIVRESRYPGRALAAYVKQEMIKRLGEFDESRYGFKQFRMFLQEAERRGLIRLITDELVDWVYLPQAAPETVEVERPAVPAETALTKLLPFADEVESRYDYVAFNFLVNRALEADILGMSRLQLAALLNDAIEQGLFLRGTYARTDPATGEEQEIRTIFLNREHPRVREALGAS